MAETPYYQASTVFHDRYELLNYLGSGAFAEAWRVLDRRMNADDLVIKVYSPRGGMEEEGIEMLRDEYEVTRKLHHDRLLTPTHFDVYDRSPYLVMELCSGGSLRDKIKSLQTGGEDYRFPERHLATVMAQIGEALHYLHGKSVCHQDVKPENILIAKDGADYRLADFGVSTNTRKTMTLSMTQAEAQQHMEKVSRGTMPYMAYESLNGAEASAKVDVFALGVSLYEVALGQLPFPNMDMTGLAISKGLKPTDLPEGYSEQLNVILRKCLALKPEDRPEPKQLADWGNAFLETGEWPSVEEAATTSGGGTTVAAGGGASGTIDDTSGKGGSGYGKVAIVVVAALILAALAYFFLMQPSGDGPETPNPSKGQSGITEETPAPGDDDPSGDDGYETYTVKAGDSMSGIAKEFYGDPSQWVRIYRANKSKIKDSETLQVGWTLRIPVEKQRATGSSAVKRLVTGNDYSPFTGSNLPNGGMITEIVKRVFKEMGNDTEVEFWAWNHGKDATQSHEFFATFPYFKGKETEEDFYFSKPLYEVVKVFFALKGSDVSYQTPEALSGKTVALPEGYTLTEGVRELVEANIVTLKRGKELKDCFQMLLDGEADVLPVTSEVGWAMVDDSPDFDESDFRELETPVSVSTMHLIVPKDIPQARSTLLKFNQAMTKLHGELSEIKRDHLKKHHAR